MEDSSPSHLLEGPWVIFDPAFMRRFIAAEAAAAALKARQARNDLFDGRVCGPSVAWERQGALAERWSGSMGQSALDGTKPLVVQRPGTCQQRGTSRFTGVSRSASYDRHKPYKAVITINKKQVFLGYFNSEIDAALAYDRASIKFRGPDRAKVNFPESLVAAFAPYSSFPSNYAQSLVPETLKRFKPTLDDIAN